MTSIPGNVLSLSLSSDLLMRDNLFEIITSSRTFYVQVKSSSPTPRRRGLSFSVASVLAGLLFPLLSLLFCSKFLGDKFSPPIVSPGPMSF